MSVDSRTISRRALLAEGWSRKSIDAAVAAGTVIRSRRDRYLSSTTPRDIVHAVRVGGRLTCLSLLAMLGVFVFDNSTLHVHMTHGSSRMRSPHDRHQRLPPRSKRGKLHLHWTPLLTSCRQDATCVGIVDAVAHAVLCQAPRYAIASIDSAMNKGLIRMSDLNEVFAALPSRYAILRSFVDGRAQSGPETLVRLMLRSMGVRIDLQVEFEGVGFVDLLVDGWLVIECDSKEFHENWKQQVKDRNRDLALAARGYVTLRLTAAQIMYRPDEVRAAILGMLNAHHARR